MIREEHFYFASKDGITKSHGMRWIPEGEVLAVVQLVHGMAEYVERYRGFAEYLAGKGILVVGHDHLGHGESVQSDDKLGYFAAENGNRTVIGDIHRVYLLTKKEYGNVPYIMFGHSMGSFLTRQYLCERGTDLDGAVICGTGYQPTGITKLGMTLCKIIAKTRGWKYRSNLLLNMSVGSYNKKFKPNRTDSDWLCRDNEIVDKYVQDPKCGFTFTVNGYYNMFLGLSKIVSKDYLEKMPKELPVYFIAGEMDPVGDCGKGVSQVVQLFRDMGMKNVTCKLYPDSRHEILNELDKETVYEDVWKWLQDII